MKNEPMNLLIRIFKYRFNLDEDKAAEDEIIENIKKGIEFKGANLWTLIFAILIASIGLNVNSTAVIIGAMLISPLMGPIMGIGLGAGIFDFNLIKLSLKNLAIASLIGLLTSTVYFLLSPLHYAQSELLARTSPTIWDVLIAFFGGLAGIVASSRKKYNNVIPGVAIATALMPPLCTAGFGIATLQWSYFFGAFYLFVINSVFISISTFLIVRFLKFRPVSYVNNDTSAKVQRWVGIIAVLTIIPSVYLAYHFVKNEIFRQNVTQLINNEIIMNGLTVISKKEDPDKKEIVITILDNTKTDSLQQVLEFKKDKYDLSDTRLLIKGTGGSAENEISVNDLKEGIVEDLFGKQEQLLKQKNNEIRELKSMNDRQLKFRQKKAEAVEEFYSLYGETKELIIEQAVVYKGDKTDTVLLAYVKPKYKRYTNSQLESMQKWLKAKFKIKEVKVISRH
jgi:uncharacterized hydrophobic protein (TIGR00271 family)